MQGVTHQDPARSSFGAQQGGAPFGGQQVSASEAALECFKEFSREKPEVVAMWAFGIGFVLGWKLRIW